MEPWARRSLVVGMPHPVATPRVRRENTPNTPPACRGTSTPSTPRGPALHSRPLRSREFPDMRRLLLLGRIDRRRPAAIAIAWLLGLSAASRGQDDKARQPPVPATAAVIAAGTAVVPTAPDLPVRGDGDGTAASDCAGRSARPSPTTPRPPSPALRTPVLTPLWATTMRRAANLKRPSPITPRPSGSMRGTPTLTRGGRRPGSGSSIARRRSPTTPRRSHSSRRIRSTSSREARLVAPGRSRPGHRRFRRGHPPRPR